MKRSLAKLAIAGTIGGLLCAAQTAAQIRPASRTAHVEIISGPELEFARDDLAIIIWTSTNPGGDDEHFGVDAAGRLSKGRAWTPPEASRRAPVHFMLERAEAPVYLHEDSPDIANI